MDRERSVNFEMSFWCFNFSQKMNKIKSTWDITVAKSNFFAHFFGRIEDTKKSFWNYLTLINWFRNFETGFNRYCRRQQRGVRTFSVKRQIAPRNAVVQVLTWYVFALVLVNQERRISVFFSAGFFNVTPFILVEIILNSKSKFVVETLKYNFFYSSRFGEMGNFLF